MVFYVEKFKEYNSSINCTKKACIKLGEVWNAMSSKDKEVCCFMIGKYCH